MLRTVPAKSCVNGFLSDAGVQMSWVLDEKFCDWAKMFHVTHIQAIADAWFNGINYDRIRVQKDPRFGAWLCHSGVFERNTAE